MGDVIQTLMKLKMEGDGKKTRETEKGKKIGNEERKKVKKNIEREEKLKREKKRKRKDNQ